MSRRRKHVVQGLQDDVEAPKPGQIVVRVMGTRGGNIVEVEFPDGRQTLVMMPQKFVKKLYVKRGGFVIVEDGGAEAEASGKVTGNIVQILYEEHVKALKKMPGAWPEQFAAPSQQAGGRQDPDLPPSCSQSEGEEEGAAPGAGGARGDAAGDAADSSGQGQPDATTGPAGAEHHGGESEDSDDGLPPLMANTNRKVIVHEVSEDEDSDSDG